MKVPVHEGRGGEGGIRKWIHANIVEVSELRQISQLEVKNHAQKACLFNHRRLDLDGT